MARILDVYLHPRRAARALEALPELEKRLVGLDEERKGERRENAEALAQATEQAAALERRLSELKRSEELYRKRCGMLESRAHELKESADRLRETLETERREADDAMAEISRRLDGTEAMRNSYEHRIRHLRHALAEARVRLSAQADYEAVSEMVDMAERKQKSAVADVAGAASKKNDDVRDEDYDPNDWLMSLP